MRIAVTGNIGQIVMALRERGQVLGYEVVNVGRPRLDLSDPSLVRLALAELKPNAIVSAAAYTSVDKAESEPEIASRINGDGAGFVAKAAAEIGVPVIHMSTDYVFNGNKDGPYVETDPTCPINAYGASKLKGEMALAQITANHVILRAGWVYSPFGNNFVKTMLRLAETYPQISVVADQWGGPTSALDIADSVLRIAARIVVDPSPYLRGIFHLPPEGTCSWADFASAIFKGAIKRGAKGAHIKRIATAEYPTLACRPANSCLSGDKIAQIYSIRLPHWQQSLENSLDRLIQIAPENRAG